MIEVEVPKDIRQYEAKIVGPLTTRNLVCTVPGAVVAIAVGLFVKMHVPSDLYLFIGMLCFLPFGLCGWISIYGMPFEQFFMSYLFCSILAPANRKYVTENIYDDQSSVQKKQKKKYKKSKNPENIGYN